VLELETLETTEIELSEAETGAAVRRYLAERRPAKLV